LEIVGGGGGSIQLLRIHIDEHLTWKYHIQHINNKRRLFIINKVKNFLPKSTLQTLYFSLKHSRILYGITAWGPANHNNENNKTLTILKMAIRIINKTTHRSHIDPLFKTCKMLKLSDVYEQLSILFVYDYETNMSYKNMFRHNYDIHRSNIYTDIPRNKLVGKCPKLYYSKAGGQMDGNIRRAQIQT